MEKGDSDRAPPSASLQALLEEDDDSSSSAATAATADDDHFAAAQPPMPPPPPPTTSSDLTATAASLETTVVARVERALPLLDITSEVRPRFPPKQSLNLEAPALAALFSKALFGLVVTLNELFVVLVDVGERVGNVSGGGSKVEGEEEEEEEDRDEDEDEDEDEGDGNCDGRIELVGRLVGVGVNDGEEEDELTVPDHYRGMVEVETRVFLAVDDVATDTLSLANNVSKAAAPPPKDIVDVTTGDDEWFPVKKKLLRPCIALTSAVMSGSGVHEHAEAKARVEADCCTFDRVLLYLEATARGQAFDFDPEYLEDMTKAAEELKLQGLVDLCNQKRGAFDSRVRKEPITFDEVLQRNAAGEMLLTMDGMVLDVTRWLDEHPGGSTIIPEQALNMDSTVFFEIYHASRQSFLYVKEFYVGELRAEDRARVPRPGGDASPAFVDTLRTFTSWRLRLDDAAEQRAMKSF